MESNTITTRVFISDDHPIYREGIVRIIKNEKSFELAGVFQDDDLLTAVRTSSPDVVLTSLHNTKTDIIAAIRMIACKYPNTVVLTISSFEHDTEIIRAIKAGAHGCILRTANRAELVQAIQIARNFKYYYSKEIAGRLANLIGRGEAKKYMLESLPHVNEKDKIFIKHLCSGLSMKEIAAVMDISVHTLESKKRKIYSRLNTPNIAALMNYAILNGFYNPYAKVIT
jgi:DNA-binding NarL/FixJ family response regulator